jgi:hypothetical protein
MIRNIRKNQRVITEITEFSISPYTPECRIVCLGIDGDIRGPRRAGVVSQTDTGECWIRWSNNIPSEVRRSIAELIQHNPNTKFYHL